MRGTPPWPAIAWALAVTLAAALPAVAQDGDPPRVKPPEEEPAEEEPGDEGPDDPDEAPGAKAPPPAPEPKAIRASLPGSIVAVLVTLRDFRPEADEEGTADPASPRLFFGHLGEGRTTLSLTASKDAERRAAAEARDFAAKRLDPPAATFDVGGVPCSESYAAYPEAPGAKQVHRHAYASAGGWIFDLHLSAVSFEGRPDATRADFEAIVRSLRFGWFRRGFPELHPRPVLDAMDRAVRRTPDEARFLEEEIRTRPEDGAVQLVLGEALLAADRHEKAAAAFEKAAERLARGADAGAPREDRFALWLALDGAAAALLRGGKTDRARAHLGRAKDLAAALGLPALRAAAAHGLARCAGEKGDGKLAASLLKEALSLDPSLRDGVKEDPCFRRVLVHREFKAALGE